ncbi:MAG: hypothetical protein MZV64_18795 [Ignavibacteriales bacterium]|nr:hypothetical protein [Ignavibacteriales bacterium]
MLSQKGRVPKQGPDRRRARPATAAATTPWPPPPRPRPSPSRRPWTSPRPQGHDQGFRLAGRGDRRQPALHDPGRAVRGRRRGHRQPQRRAASARATAVGRQRPVLDHLLLQGQDGPRRPARPGSGRSALDAVEIMNVATNFLREHLPLSQRMHYVILEGGEAPNVVPDKASVWYYVRNTDERLEDMYERVVNCAKAGALAAGDGAGPVRVISAIHQTPRQQGRWPSSSRRTSSSSGCRPGSEEEQAFAKALQKELGCRTEAGMPEEGGQARSASTGDVRRGRLRPDAGDVRDGLMALAATVTFPRLGARRDRPPLVQRRLLVRFDRLEGPERRGQGHRRRFGRRPPDQARGARPSSGRSSRSTRKTAPLLAVPAPPMPQPPNDLNKELMDKYRSALAKALAEIEKWGHVLKGPVKALWGVSLLFTYRSV